MLATVAAGFFGACGNYSNEDLAYMSVVPQSEELESNLPAAQGAEQIAGAAELYKTTHNVSDTLNGILGKFLVLIETVRAYTPTSRTPTSRTWGPYPSLEHPGWLAEMEINRDPVMPDEKFDYWFGFVPATAPHGDPIHVLDGSFQLGMSVREGHGTLNVATAASRAAGIDLGFGVLDHMEVTYDVMGPTVAVHMTITNLPNPLKPDDILTATYDYHRVADGSGDMMFQFDANAIPGPAGTETFRITSHWLGTGAGRAQSAVIAGDAAGAQQDECWGPGFTPTYNLKPWSPAENVGDPSLCPDFPTTP
ncbi:MAG TPA: hypothetical protein VGL59_26215 [Polyangia bacterium]